jgi:hypothetical protein
VADTFSKDLTAVFCDKHVNALVLGNMILQNEITPGGDVNDTG